MVLDHGAITVLGAPEATYGFTDLDAPRPSDVQLTPVTPHGWRVSDTRLPLRDPLRLLAYIERRDEVYEVMQLGRGFEWHEFSSLDDAFDFVLRTSARFAQARLQIEWSGWDCCSFR